MDQNFSTDGREWAKMSELKAGEFVQTDMGFTCGINGQKIQLGKDQDGFYVLCHAGKHHLDGQLADDGDHLIGIWRM